MLLFRPVGISIGYVITLDTESGKSACRGFALSLIHVNHLSVNRLSVLFGRVPGSHQHYSRTKIPFILPYRNHKPGGENELLTCWPINMKGEND